MSTKLSTRHLLTISLCLIAGEQASAQTSPTYYFNYYGSGSTVSAINNLGHAIGIDTNGQSFLWNGSSATVMPATSYARAINDLDQVAGNVQSGAAKWSGNTVTALPGVDYYAGSATAINNSGQVAGTVSYPEHAAIWNGTTATDLGTLGGNESHATDINNSGQVVGYSTLTNNAGEHATLWSGGTITDLGSLGEESRAMAINDAGSIVGYSYLTGYTGQHATLWKSGQMIDLGSLPGSSYSHANAINKSGQIVGGAVLDAAVYTPRAVIWNGTQATDLNSFLDASAVNAGWVLEDATGINDQGWIVGLAYNAKYDIGSGFMLSTTAIGGYTPPPVPEPGTYALTALGLLAAGYVARGRKRV